ncbi:MAG TPA: adenosylcobinamide-GDP ribazoletransferase [Gaiellaceae bacterium]|jgi:adenosylcobinamide-GDP ribazoletransferase|nr:adenosylcobinamide-GDP ribazoletransferase [Gaiellaceae bacterium]
MQVVSAELRGVAAALAFLTRVPVGRSVELDAADISRGAVAFPLVGAGIGAATGGVVAALAGSLTAPLAAVLGLVVAAVLTGALHLDALADTADALGAWTRERALEIMRDHSIGSYGGVALVLDLAVKGVALAVLAQRHDVVRFAVCAGAAARVAPVLLSAVLPYARTTAGLGRALGAAGASRCGAAVAVGAAFCVGLEGLDGAVVLGVVGVIAVVAGIWSLRRLGGITGDVLGATTELCEAAALVAAVALT